MALINFKDIDFNKSINKELKTFDFNGTEIGVVPYLPIDDKYDLVMVTLQKSLEKGIYNHVKLNMFFELHLVYMYTNIQIDIEERQDEARLYDTLKRSGLIEMVLANINQNELETLWKNIKEMEDIMMSYRNTFGSVVNAFIEQLPDNMEKVKDIIATLDMEKVNTIVNRFKESAEISQEEKE